MSWLSALGKVASASKGLLTSGAGKLAMTVGRSLPVVGTVIGAADLAMTAYDAFGSKASSGGGLPALPSAPGLGPDAMRGPGGSLQMPGFGPNKGSLGQANTLDDRYLKIAYKAPRGYVVAWDGGHRGVGKPFPVLRRDAIHMRYPDGSRVFHPHHKPPISVGQWHKLKGAAHVVKKLHMVEKEAQKVARFAGRGHHHHTSALQITHKKK